LDAPLVMLLASRLDIAALAALDCADLAPNSRRLRKRT